MEVRCVNERAPGEADNSQRFCEALRQRIGETRYATWFAGAEGSVGIAVSRTDAALDQPEVRLTIGSSFEQSILRRQFQADLDAVASHVLGSGCRIVFAVREAAAAATAANPPQRSAKPLPPVAPVSNEATPQAVPTAPAASEPQTKPRRPLDPLEGWVVGEGNAPATRLCQRLISGDDSASPVLFWGPSGVGKTHLLKAIADGARARRRKVLSVTAEQFLRGFVEAARGGGFPSFRQKHQGADVLLVDDVQQLIGKTRTLEEFRQTIDAAIEAGATIVLTADRGPLELRELGPEMTSRLAGGLAVETPLPDAAVREGLVRRAAAKAGLDVSETVVRTLACRLMGGGREVQGAVHRMALIHETFATPLDADLAARVADDSNRLSTPPVRLADIQRAVCGVCGVDAKMLRSDKRTKAVTEPRMLAMWLSRKMTGRAWSEIGDYYGRRSHSTVIAAHRRVETLLAKGEPTRLCTGDMGETIRRIEAALRSAC